MAAKDTQPLKSDESDEPDSDDEERRQMVLVGSDDEVASSHGPGTTSGKTQSPIADALKTPLTRKRKLVELGDQYLEEDVFIWVYVIMPELAACGHKNTARCTLEIQEGGSPAHHVFSHRYLRHEQIYSLRMPYNIKSSKCPKTKHFAYISCWN